MKVRFSGDAAQRYDAVLGYIREENPLAADRMVTAVNRSLRRLQDFPLIGSRPREFPGLPLRQVIVEPYRFFYIIESDGRTVTIVDVWHGAQLPDEPQLPAP